MSNSLNFLNPISFIKAKIEKTQKKYKNKRKTDLFILNTIAKILQDDAIEKKSTNISEEYETSYKDAYQSQKIQYHLEGAFRNEYEINQIYEDYFIFFNARKKILLFKR